jgi:hypothetical protein
MKSAIYIAEGVTQFVLTPETEIDKKVLSQIEKAKGMSTVRGSFYECAGGWVRYKAFPTDFMGNERADDSLIFVVREQKEKEEQDQIRTITA